ncbi:hypothetical protein MRB53_030668 [Persea americana]|uniref:Uncharacterized protein n=1 Tax=Persea americana TaxID=3435 RepID=A0ACC2KMG3_PERAE|nr:hypothetical protein MRB53_030668 [Persea americana]
MDWMEDDGQRWVAACRKKKMGGLGLLERAEMEGRKTDWVEDDGQRWVVGETELFGGIFKDVPIAQVVPDIEVPRMVVCEFFVML